MRPIAVSIFPLMVTVTSFIEMARRALDAIPDTVIPGVVSNSDVKIYISIFELLIENY